MCISIMMVISIMCLSLYHVSRVPCCRFRQHTASKKILLLLLLIIIIIIIIMIIIITVTLYTTKHGYDKLEVVIMVVL